MFGLSDLSIVESLYALKLIFDEKGATTAEL